MPLTGELAEIVRSHKLLRMKLLRLIHHPVSGDHDWGIQTSMWIASFEELGCELQQPSRLGGICLEVETKTNCGTSVKRDGRGRRSFPLPPQHHVPVSVQGAMFLYPVQP